MLVSALTACLAATAEDNPRKPHDKAPGSGASVFRDGKRGEPLFNDGSLFGDKMTEDKLRQQTFETLLRDYGRDDALGRELATKRVDHIFEWRKVYVQTVDAAYAAAQRSLLQADMDDHGYPPGVSVLYETERIRAWGEVTAVFDIGYRGLREMPSFKLDEKGREALVQQLQDELLSIDRVTQAVAKEGRPQPREQPAMVRHIRKTAQIRVEFEPYREIVTVFLEKPRQIETSIVGHIIAKYLSDKRRDHAASESRSALADREAQLPAIKDSKHQARQQQLLEQSRKLHERRFADAKLIDPDIMYLELHDAYQSYKKQIIERAQREFGRDFERKANRR